jgi:toxin-antitoxin system PIN domain toxin
VSRPALLDVNVLIALFDESHVHYQIAHDWFAGERHRGWATCPLTENGFVRVMSQPIPGRAPLQPSVLAMHLRGFCSSVDHVFWPASISLLDPDRFDLSATRGRHLSDVYLAGLAHAHGGVLATFDRTIPIKPIVGASADLLEVIGP